MTTGLGLRIGEALGLRWQDVDRERSVLHVRKALQRSGGDPVARRRLLAERKRLKRDLKNTEGDHTKQDAIQADLVAVRKQLKAAGDVGSCRAESSRRAIQMPTRVVKALKAHRVRQLQERLAGGDWRELDFVFPTSIGTPMDARNVSLRGFAYRHELATHPSS